MLNLKKIQYKFILFFVLTVSTVSLTLSGYSLNNALNNATDYAYKDLSVLLERTKLTLENQFQQLENRTEDLKGFFFETIDIEKLKNPELNQEYAKEYLKEFKPIMQSVAKRMEHNLDLYFFFNHDIVRKTETEFYSLLLVEDENGDYPDWDQMPLINELDQSSSSYAWYFDPVIKTKGSWTNPYSDEYLADDLFTYSTPIYIDNEFIGLIGLDVTFTTTEQIVESIEVYETGYAVLLNSDLNFLIHPKYDLNDSLFTIDNNKLSNVGDYILKNRNGIKEYEYKNKEKLTIFTELNNGWFLTINPDKSIVLASVNNLRILLIGVNVIVFILAITLATIYSSYISKPIIIIKKSFSKIANKEQVSDEDLLTMFTFNEIDSLITSYHKIRANQVKLISDLISDSNSLYVSSENKYNVSSLLEKKHEDFIFLISDIQENLSAALTEGSNFVGELESVSDISVNKVKNLIFIQSKLTYSIELLNKDITYINNINRQLQFFVDNYDIKNTYNNELLDSFFKECMNIIDLYKNNISKHDIVEMNISDLESKNFNLKQSNLSNETTDFKRVLTTLENLIKAIKSDSNELSLQYRQLNDDENIISQTSSDILKYINKYKTKDIEYEE